ncbi:MAG TPA: DedA family protein [Ramlibacter sp.]|jgi:membrane protein DedA with SNARE-associated domain|uniref:DedA family protein n=1 Tax=Ramlibacter sp. TaxID=1917967 RepID=UPI002D704A9F|nr:DedA family protein [Ramlibacter sp.]HZY16936.1 DedA family protein [Ramlibacter sp.]
MSGWIIDVVERAGYAGIVLLMLLETVFPPVPSELVLPFAGYVAATGRLHPAGVLAAATLGSLLGALAWYALGRRLGLGGVQRFAASHGRLLTLTPDDVGRAQAWFRRHGPSSVGLGRLVPAVRSVISLPAGVARMPVPAFVGWSGLGTLAWSALLVGAGYLLRGQYDTAHGVVEWVTRAVVAGLVAGYAWRVWRFGRGPQKSTL